MFSFAMTTVNRKPEEYFFKTLSSLLAADQTIIPYLPLHIYLGTPDTQYTDYIKHHKLFDIHGLTWEDWKIVYDATTIQRINLNSSRLLVEQSKKNNNIGLIYLEDDIKFVDNWFVIFNKLLKKYSILSQSIIQLYHMHEQYEEEILKVPYDQAIGAQCLFIPQNLILDLSKEIYKGVLTMGGKRGITDAIMFDYCKLKNIQIFAICPPLVQHEGLYSTGCGGGYFGDYKVFSHSNTFDKRLANTI